VGYRESKGIGGSNPLRFIVENDFLYNTHLWKEISICQKDYA
jgi:hypothetical protein